VNLSSLASGTSVLSDPAGNLCSGQRTPGAFGGEARLVRESGAPLLSEGIFAVTLGDAFCLPATGNEFLDASADLPGPGAISVPGTLAFDLLPQGCARTPKAVVPPDARSAASSSGENLP
jgi:hypothetical protein